MCQSEELKCDSKLLKVHLLWVQRLYEVEDVWLCGLAELQTVLGLPAVHWWAQIGVLGIQRSPSDCCFSVRTLLGFRKCTAQCVCNFLCPACMQDISTVSVPHMCAPMQHPSAAYWQGKGWDLGFECFMVLSPSQLHRVCYRGCAFTGKIQIEENKYIYSYP